MARSFASPLPVLVRHDGAWLRCVAQGCDAYWGDFRPTAWVALKAQQHAAKAHGARPARAQAGRPQRRAAGAQGAADIDGALIEAAVAAVLAAGPRALGRGVSRKVFPFGPNFVLKVAHDPREGHNLAEYNAYQNAPDWARPHLAPALRVDPKGVWLLMQAATRVSECSPADARALHKALQGKVGDLHEANIGWLDGRWVAIDYAGGFQAVNPW